jgi:hypothetical protein
VFQSGSGSHASRPVSSYCFKEPSGIIWRPPFQHGVYSAPEFLGDDRQRLGFAVSADQSLVIKLTPLISPKEQAGCLTEGPFQMDISVLVVWACLALTPRFMNAFHQPCVGNEVAHRGERIEVVDLVEDHQGTASTSTLVRTTGSVKRVPMPARLDLRSIRFSKYGRLYCVLVFWMCV